jgi:hypothetical protein
VGDEQAPDFLADEVGFLGPQPAAGFEQLRFDLTQR